MDEHTANLLLCAITAVAALAWLAGLQFLLATARGSQPEPDPQFDQGEPSERARIQGTAEVDGEPDRLAARAASLLAKGSMSPLGPQRIVQRTEGSVVFEGASDSPGLGRYIQRGFLHFTRLSSGRTRIDYAVELCCRRGLLWAGAIFQVLGLAAIVAGFLLIRTYVAASPHPAIRGQTLQMVQIVHFLWPPFLFSGLYRRQCTVLRSTFSTFVHNLPYYGA